MPKHTLKKLIPSASELKERKALHLFGDWIYEGNLWHLNRYSASMGFFVGLFMAFIPIPGQMFVAAALAVWLRCNLPLSISLVWITNPLTMPAIFFFAYELGAFILGVDTQAIQFELSFAWLAATLGAIWQPFLLGCFLFSLGFGALGYFVVDIMWKAQIRRKWRERKLKRDTRD